MALPNVNVSLGNGGLGRPLDGKDHYSGILFYTDNGDTTLPTGFGSDNVKQVFSLKEAEDLGITVDNVTFAILHYHIREFFRVQPLGVLFIGVYEAQLTQTYAEIDLVQKEANGEVRQMGVYENLTFATATLSTIQGVAQTLRNENQPLSVLYAGDISAVVSVGSMEDLTALTNPLVSVVIGQDGSGKGAELFATYSNSITTLGATLGTVAKMSVNESIAWVERTDLQNGDEYDVVLFANGESVKAQSKAFLNTLNDKGYIFLRKFTDVGLAGSYHNDSATAVAETSDFATIENNRTIDKASRLLLFYTLPKLNSPLRVNENGQLSEATIAVFKNICDTAMEQMAIAGEVSAYQVLIDPTQNVLSTSELAISVEIVPVGVGRTISFTIGYTLNLG